MEGSPHLSLVAAPSTLEPTGLSTRNDDELMLLARGGLERAFGVLIERHQARTLRLAVRYLGRESLAADVTQDTFVEIFRALPQYQARGKFSAYLYRALLNRCHMTFRALRTEQQALRIAAEGLVESDEQELLLHERRRDLHAALGELSDKLRSVVLLRISAELSYEEIAETLEIPTGTVKRRLFDAIAKLRERLEVA
jgi:RNA polymerase sigma-70 factor (ECF subfamily)